MHKALIPKANPQTIQAVDQFSREARNEIARAQRENNPMALALYTARSIQGLRELVTDDMLTDIMALMNTQLGFETDRDPSRPGRDGPARPYGKDVVKDCFITSQLWGASPINCEWGIFSGRAYRKVNYYRRMVHTVPGVTDVHYQLGDPQLINERKALVAGVCRWKQGGQVRRRACEKGPEGDYRIPVRVNKGMGDDALKAKAERRLLALALADMEERSLTEADLDPLEDSSVVNGQVLSTDVDYQPGSVGDDIAQDAEQHLGDQTPANAPTTPESDTSERHRMAVATMKIKADIGQKAAAAWVRACAEMDPPVDIADATDEYLKSDEYREKQAKKKGRAA